MPGLKRQTKERTGQPLPTIWQAAVGDCAHALAWSSNGRWLAAAAISGPITLFDGLTGQARVRLKGHTLGTTSLSWQPQEPLLASSGQDGKVRLWDSETGAEQRALDAGASWVERVAWSPAGDMLAAAAGRTLRFWDASGQVLREHADHPSTIADIQWRPGGRELAAAVYGGVVLRHADQPDLVRRFAWEGVQPGAGLEPTRRILPPASRILPSIFGWSRQDKTFRCGAMRPKRSNFPGTTRAAIWQQEAAPAL
jgi:hypothetical protein